MITNDIEPLAVPQPAPESPTPSAQTLPSARLALPADGSIRKGLITAFGDVLAYARAQDASTDSVRAVHEFRKSVRRSRALLRLLRDFVGIDAYESLEGRLREIHRSTSRLRDQDVVLDVVERLDLGDEGQAAVSAIEAVRDLDHSTDTKTVAEVLNGGGEQMESMPQLLSSALPGKVKWLFVADGLATTYRRAQRKRRSIARGGDDDVVHSFRKRIKELTYQVELFTALAGKRSRKLRKQLSRLSEELGTVADLLMLRAYLTDSACEDAELAGVLKAIEVHRKRRLVRALARADRLLADSPTAFARKVIKAAQKAHVAAT